MTDKKHMLILTTTELTDLLYATVQTRYLREHPNVRERMFRVHEKLRKRVDPYAQEGVMIDEKKEYKEGTD